MRPKALRKKRRATIQLSFRSFPITPSAHFMEINYKIIGGDGREYGPVTLDELKGWVRDGRVGRQTQILRSDLGNWLAASQYQELQSEIGMLKPTVTGVEGDFEPVGFWARVGATVIDSLFLYLAFSILLSPIAKLFGVQIPTNLNFSAMTPVQIVEEFRPFITFASYFFIILTAIYEIALTGKFGATFGKMIFGMRIIKVDGSAFDYKYALYRFLSKMISSMACYIGYLMVAFREDKRGLHDLIVGTRVIYKR
jgi:uncharacterized RDD family membrane protein YckC